MSKIFYTSGEIDRYSELRGKYELLSEVILNGNARFIPIWENQNFFVKNNDDFNALLLKIDELKSIISNFKLEDLIFLGVTSKIYYFSINLSKNYTENFKLINNQEIECGDLRLFSRTLNQTESSFLALAKGMTFWHMNNRFCSVCGAKTIVREAGFVIKCIEKDCETSHFPRTDPAMITLISFQNEILLARSPRFPERMYSTLAGFVEPGETLEQAVYREVFEEVGIGVKNISYFGSQPWPFPASLMLGFFAEAEKKELKIDYNEIEDAQWFTFENIEELTHPSIIDGFKLPRADSIARRLVNFWLKNYKG